MVKSHYKFFILQLLLVLSFFVLSTPVFAEESGLGLSGRVNSFYKWSLGIGAVAAVIIIVYAGVVYIISGGNESRIGEAKKWIGSALLGFAILLSAVVILNFINPDLKSLGEPPINQNPDEDYTFVLPPTNTNPEETSGFVELCTDDNPCVTGPFFEMSVVEEERNCVGAVSSTEIGNDETTYVIIADNVKVICLFRDDDFKGPRVRIVKTGILDATCTVENADGTFRRDCTGSIEYFLGRDVGDVFGVNMANYFNDAISSVKVFGGEIESSALDCDTDC
jgi:hypothetical protein